jgi:replicative DNA helicase
METNINQVRLKTGQLAQSDWIKLTRAIKILSKLPIFIDDTVNLSINDIRSKIKTILFEQKKIGLVIIDYLQLMQLSNLKPETRAQELSQITRLLKTIAREFNIPIIALSQLSRNVENRVDKKPVLSDLRESGSIEQDADLVLMLYRNQLSRSDSLNSSQNFETDYIELILAKHRNGPTGVIQLQFDEKRMKFSSLLK